MPNAEFFIGAAKQTLFMTLVLTTPPVLAAMIVGLVISILQATTQIQEQTLTFVPKLVVVLAILFFMGPQMLEQLVTFTSELMTNFPFALP